MKRLVRSYVRTYGGQSWTQKLKDGDQSLTQKFNKQSSHVFPIKRVIMLLPQHHCTHGCDLCTLGRNSHRFCRFSEGHNFLIVVYSHSKRLKIIELKSTTACLQDLVFLNIQCLTINLSSCPLNVLNSKQQIALACKMFTLSFFI